MQHTAIMTAFSGVGRICSQICIAFAGGMLESAQQLHASLYLCTYSTVCVELLSGLFSKAQMLGVNLIDCRAARPRTDNRIDIISMTGSLCMHCAVVVCEHGSIR